MTPVKDERYWSKLNFPKRAMSNVQTVDQKVTVAEKDGGFELRFDISGHEGVPVTIELAFRSGGKLSGVEEDAESHSFFLKEGTGKYTAGTDTIEFGPGEHVHRFISLEGHTYRAHNGSLKPAGQCVYITGVTPFQRTLRIR